MEPKLERPAVSATSQGKPDGAHSIPPLSFTRPLRRVLAILALMVTAAVLCLGGGTAHALRPQQYYVTGVVNAMAPNVNYFWWAKLGSQYRVAPSIVYYNYGSTGHITTCSGVSTATWSWGSYDAWCNRIYLDYRGLQALVAGYGDYTAGGVLAHEWGHAIQAIIGGLNRGYKSEYHADCLAGMSTQYAHYSGLLDTGDFWEFYWQLYYSGDSVTHGKGVERAAWFWYGHTYRSLEVCNRVLS
jgi:predicted metalloprotease